MHYLNKGGMMFATQPVEDLVQSMIQRLAQHAADGRFSGSDACVRDSVDSLQGDATLKLRWTLALQVSMHDTLASILYEQLVEKVVHAWFHQYIDNLRV